MHPAWARSLRDQCAAAGVPFFFKQWGAYAPSRTSVPPSEDDINRLGDHMVHVGKKAAGRLLDGRVHDAMPKDSSDQRQ
jgi:protein gp37